MRNKKIAIIDTDKQFISEIEQTLLKSGYAPVLVIDPLLAVETVIKNKPDVILLELRIPEKNGFELTDAFHRSYEISQIPIIAMSTFFKEEFNWFINFCGIKRFLKKPFHPLDAIWAIENELKEGSPWNS